MFEINYINLDKEIKVKRKSIVVSIVLAIIVSIVLYFAYFYFSEKNELIGKIAIAILVVSALDIIFSIIRFITTKKYKSTAKYLEKNGVLLNDQKITIDNTIFNILYKPTVYYVAPNGKLYKLRAKSVLDLMGKGTVDVLIDINNPKRYYMDANIKTTKEFDKEKNYSHFSEKTYYPDYMSYMERRKSSITNMFIFIIMIGIMLYIAYKKDETLIRTASLLVAMFSLTNVFILIKSVIDSNKMISKIKRVSTHGTLVNDLDYEKPKEKDVKEFTPTVMHNNKKYKGTPIINNPKKDKIDLLIYKKEYIINYDIKNYKDHYRN